MSNIFIVMSCDKLFSSTRLNNIYKKCYSYFCSKFIYYVNYSSYITTPFTLNVNFYSNTATGF